MPDKDPLGSKESVQLFQEHAARTTQQLPFKLSPSTMYAMGVFVFLAAIGLSIRVGDIRGDLEEKWKESEEVGSAVPEQVRAKLFSSESTEADEATPATESEVEQMMDAYRAEADAQMEAQLASIQEKLYSGDLALRTQAGLTLRERRPGFPVLIEALGSSDEMVRRQAANSLSLSENAPADLAGPALLKAVQEDPDPYVREYAAIGLGRFKPEGARETLAEMAATDESDDIRQAALTGLMYWNDMIVYPVLHDALDDSLLRNRYVAGAAISRLAYDRRRDPIPEEWVEAFGSSISAMLSCADARVRARGFETAGYLRMPSFSQRMIVAIGDPTDIDEETGTIQGKDDSWEVRARACEALGYLYDGEAGRRNDAIAHVVNALVMTEAFDTDAAVRWKATEALGRTGYDANEWGKLEILSTRPREALEGDQALEFSGGAGHDH